jgi:hypothetical protein
MIQNKSPEAKTDDVVAELRKREAFVFVSHVKPDGDTLGAGLALGLALRAMGKRVHYFQQDPVPRNLRFPARQRSRLARRPGGFAGRCAVGFLRHERHLARRRVSSAARAPQHPRHRSPPRQHALRGAELRARKGVFDRNLRAAFVARAAGSDHARDRDLSA